MKRALSIALALLAPIAAQAAPIPLAEISAYLNSVTTADTSFQQVNSDGSVSTGHVYIQRPGRMRFEYAKPDNTLVLASGGQVAIFDAKSNQPPEQYPLAKTPLNIILGKEIDLARSKMVANVREEGDLTIVTAQDPKHPDYGMIELGFGKNPVALKQWVVTDGTGAQTMVLLGDMALGGTYDNTLFSINYAISQLK